MSTVGFFASSGLTDGGEWTKVLELGTVDRARFIVQNKDDLVDLGYDWKRVGTYAAAIADLGELADD